MATPATTTAPTESTTRSNVPTAPSHRIWSARDRGRIVTSVTISGLLFAEVLLIGGNSTDLALPFGGLWLLLLAALLTRPWARDALDQARLTWIGLTFGAVLLAGVVSLTPFAIGGPHPVWAWVDGARRITSVDPYLTLIELIKLAVLAAVFLTGVLVGSDDDRAKSLIRCLLGFGLAYSLWAFADHVINPETIFGASRPFDPTRLSASLASANTAATFFGALTLLNLVNLDRRFQSERSGGKLDIRRLDRLAPKIALPLVSLAAAASCLILTLSRAGLAATAAMSAVLIGGTVLARSRQGAISVMALATIVVFGGVVLGSLALNLGSLQDRANVLSNDVVARGDIFAAHWAAFNAAPASGYGLGTFAHVNSMIMDQTNVRSLELLGAVHNVYLQWLEQAGVIGAAPMFACIGLIALKIGRGAIRRRRMRPWLVGVLAVLMLFLIHGATDFALEVPALAALLSLLAGVGCGAADVRRPSAAQARSAAKSGSDSSLGAIRKFETV